MFCLLHLLAALPWQLNDCICCLEMMEMVRDPGQILGMQPFNSIQLDWNQYMEWARGPCLLVTVHADGRQSFVEDKLAHICDNLYWPLI